MSAAASRPSASRRSPTRRPFTWWVVLLFAVPIVGYALAYVIVGAPVYPPNLSASFLARPWGIYPHALFGSLALGIGALQFNRWLLMRHRPLHRTLGSVYVTSAMLVGLAGLYMSIFGDFTPAYRVVAWLSWVPNLLWAVWYARRTAAVPLPAVDRPRLA